MSIALPAELQEYVNRGILLYNYAKAIAAYLGDLDRVAAAENKGKQGKLFREGSNAEARWQEGADIARKRVRDAKAAMGAAGPILHRVAKMGQSFAEVAVDLGYERPDDVRQRFVFAAHDLTRVYTQFAPQRPGRIRAMVDV